MKNKIIIFILIISNCFKFKSSNCQQVIASAGGYQSSAIGSLSFTIGETKTKTLTSANSMLTQGFNNLLKRH